MTTRVVAAALVIGAAGAVVLTARQAPAPQNLIWIAASVVHADGHLVTDLTAADFEILDNGQRRPVTEMRSDRLPIAVAIMVDVSPSMETNYGLVRSAVASLATRFEAGDRAIVGTFDSLPWIAPRFTARVDVLQKSLASALGGTLSLCDGDWIDKTRVVARSEASNRSYGAVTDFSRRLAMRGGSAIWDGAACGINAVASDGETPRRILVLLTDGVDNMSSTTIPSLIDRARQYGVIVYAVSLMGGYGMAGGELKSLAEATGGGYFFLASPADLDGAVTRIGDELRHQYILGFAADSVTGTHAITATARAANTTTRVRRVFLDTTANAPLARAAAVASAPRPGPQPGLPAQFTIGPRSAAAAGPPNPDAAIVRTPFWDTLDKFTTASWPVGTAPRMSLDTLRATLVTLKKDGIAWVRAGGTTAQAGRRLALASFVLDLLYTQNDPYVWLNGQPASDLIEWAAGAVSAGPPTPEERLWYFGALSLIERGGVSDVLDRMAQRALQRFPDEGRFALARGVAQDLLTWPEERDVHAFTVAPQIASALVARYDAATAIPSVRAEALLRLGYFELRRGRTDAALARFTAIGADTPDDPVLRYWVHLLKGRALEAANRSAEAVASYEQALEDVPGATSARAALVAALVKNQRAGEAARLAANSLSTPSADVDPWTMYVLPDMRFWQPISSSLREAVVR
ncbi:MAG TPA: VWA domain-containing protein [Vicinamibacterales bacterium]|nr:VWA domain-containing protein [Vicinamibacterales bacterium]